MTTHPQPVRLSLGFKFTWGIAAIGTSLISGTFGALLPIFYQDYLGLQARWIGLASLIYAIWNALNDPLFGYITDSTRSRLGRRIPTCVTPRPSWPSPSSWSGSHPRGPGRACCSAGC